MIHFLSFSSLNDPLSSPGWVKDISGVFGGIGSGMYSNPGNHCGGKRLYQYMNKDDFFYLSFNFYKYFSNYNITSNQKEVLKLTASLDSHFYMYPCV